MMALATVTALTSTAPCHDHVSEGLAELPGVPAGKLRSIGSAALCTALHLLMDECTTTATATTTRTASTTTLAPEASKIQVCVAHKLLTLLVGEL
jgi:hypothetical protein